MLVIIRKERKGNETTGFRFKFEQFIIDLNLKDTQKLVSIPAEIRF